MWSDAHMCNQVLLQRPTLQWLLMAPRQSPHYSPLPRQWGLPGQPLPTSTAIPQPRNLDVTPPSPSYLYPTHDRLWPDPPSACRAPWPLPQLWPQHPCPYLDGCANFHSAHTAAKLHTFYLALCGTSGILHVLCLLPTAQPEGWLPDQAAERSACSPVMLSQGVLFHSSHCHC